MRALPLVLVLSACVHSAPLTHPTEASPPASVAAEPVPAEAPQRLFDQVVLPAPPLWTDKYADTAKDYGPFFRIASLMERWSLSRLQAVEVQNQFRDLHRANLWGDVDAQLLQALASVKGGHHESGLHPTTLDAAPFIVVFDLDETLYDQYYSASLAAQCHSFRFDRGERTASVQLAPGWQAIFEQIRDAGGSIVLFSANLDEPTLENLSHWMWEGQSLLTHPDIDGVLTNSFLIEQSKDEGSNKNPVPTPSKDLRIVDPSLERVVIVDDNPTRLFQLANARVTRKFHADAWCDPTLDAPYKAALGSELDTVSRELASSIAWLQSHPNATFQQAYLPYTLLGRIAVDALAQGNGWTIDTAIAYLRDHPEAADSHF